MGFFNNTDESGFEQGIGGAVKRTAKSAVKSVMGDVKQQVSPASNDFFKQLLGDLAGSSSSEDTTANTVSTTNAVPSGDQGMEQPDPAMAQQMKQLQQSSVAQSPVPQGQGGASSPYPGIRTSEDQERLNATQAKLRALQKQHQQEYSNDFSDTETLMNKSKQQQQQEVQQKQQEEEEEKQKKKQEKKQEEQVQIEDEQRNANAKKMEKAPGAG